MRKKIATMLLVVAATLPLTINNVNAQNYYDEDIKIYSQELNARIENGRSSLSQNNYQNLRNLMDKIDMIGRAYGGRRMNDSEKASMMASMTNLDRELTKNLHDDQNARWQNWDASRRTWRQTWWKNRPNNSGWNPGGNTVNIGFNQEIDTYQRHLKQRLDWGRQSGRLSGRELANLTAQYEAIDRMQRDYRRSSFNQWERNTLLSKLAQLDRDITTQLHDNEYSHYQQWDNKQNKWSNNWYSNYSAPTYSGSQWKSDAWKNSRNDWKKDSKENWKDSKKDWKEAKDDWKDAKKDAKDDWKDAKKDSKSDWKDSKDNWKDSHDDNSDWNRRKKDRD